jgi:16S rRNA (guanine527-N7)-methyltransferase
VEFVEELRRVLPPDIPHRDRLIEKASQHLQLIAAANEHMNLTRITSAHEAAIKHVYDSVAPWRHFAQAKHVLDAGTGAGFPGIPLAIVLPHVRFTLAESTQKKARFVDGAVDALELGNVHVLADRAEQRASARHPEVITARAVAPLHRLLELFEKAVQHGSRLILYKGPEVEAELEEAKTHRVAAEVLCRYDLPDGLGSRSVLLIQANHAGRARLLREASASRL